MKTVWCGNLAVLRDVARRTGAKILLAKAFSMFPCTR